MTPRDSIDHGYLRLCWGIGEGSLLTDKIHTHARTRTAPPVDQGLTPRLSLIYSLTVSPVGVTGCSVSRSNRRSKLLLPSSSVLTCLDDLMQT
ncbi:hypothetical protein ElyMa_000630200 [Elysia marginata]|uniref:Uncharacterized protein n=1 Tax=Elysia marginata TaxID=1093978 RepID=A0AAV4GAH2_9GAST|nr:hypothetical protein ElyMa_000630200 [Elysia marginata]